MGPSGSGKSTLDAHPRRARPPDDGEVLIADTEIADLGDDALTKLRRRHVGFIFQSFNLLPILTAEENIRLPLRIAGNAADACVVDEVVRDGRAGGPARAPARPSCRAASSSASRSPARWSSRPDGDVRRRADRQPRHRRRARRCSSAAEAVERAGRPSSWSPTIRSPRRSPTASCSSPTAGSSRPRPHGRPHSPGGNGGGELE